MKKVRIINLSELRGEEWFNFFTEFKRFVEDTTPGKLNVERLFTVFLGFYIAAEEAIEKIRKSSITQQMIDLDKLRDNTFRGLIRMIESYLHHFDSNKRKAAESLSIVIKHYGNLAIKPYNQETAGIYNFLQELRENYRDAIAILDLTGWLDELERNNNEFEEAVLARNQEEASKTELRLLDIRKETNRCYKSIIERLEAIMLIEEEDGIENNDHISFVKTLNANIKRYADILAQRKGRNTDDNDEEES
jgi:hypothetical protein